MTTEARTAVHALSLHALFEQQARLTPTATALEIPPHARDPRRQRLSYADLDLAAERLADRLAAFINGEAVVALCLPRAGLDLFVAQLATHKAGGAWTVIESGTPPERLRFLLEDSRAVAVVADEPALPTLLAAGFPPDRILAPSGPAPERRPQRRASSPDSLAYVIYTSGTTGHPKGVMIEHQMAANLVHADVDYFELGSRDRVAQTTSAAYDSSVEEVWLAWGAGATVVVVDDERVRSGPDLLPWLRAERITVWCPAPTLLRMTGCEDPEHELPDLRLIYVGGEELTPDVAERWAPGRRLENGYGPTECTVTVVRAPVRAGEPVTIGFPVRGNRGFVVDDDLNTVADGTVGQLVIAGAGVARGYLGRPDLTAERFRQHPELGRIYLTGDLARRDSSGALHYLGRADTQVKVRGHRIELTAIESELCRIPGVLDAACTVGGSLDAPELVAFVVGVDGAPIDAQALRNRLRMVLPEPMVPARISRLDQLPRGALSGKLDRRALPLEDAAAAGGPRGRAAEGGAEIAVAAAFARRFPAGAGAEQDFFTELGGNSLLAAQLVSDLRRSPRTAGLTVRDLYEARTIAGLAARLAAAPSTLDAGTPEIETQPGGVARVSPHAWLTATAQYALLALALISGANLAWFVAYRAVPALVARTGVTWFILLLPSLVLGAALVWTAIAAVLTVTAKRVLIGRYATGRHPHMGSMYLRHWIVSALARSLPWDLLESTGVRATLLRALGARIGSEVHLHRGVSLHHGAWDLLTIEDGATLGRDASLGLVTHDRQQLVFGTITIGARATLDTRARMAPGSALGREAFLGALAGLEPGASVPAGEYWDGVPASAVGSAPADPTPSGESPRPGLRHSFLLLLAKALVAQVAFLPGMAIAAIVLATWQRSGATLSAWSLPYGVIALTVMAGYALSLPLQALLCRTLPRVEPGAHPLKGATALTVLLKERLVESANVALSGTLAWPLWLRAAGMKVGRRCEISTIMEVTPELVSIADDCFFADGIYLGRPLLHRGHLICARTSFEPRTFLGNHAVIPAGAQLPGGILIGVCTVADPARITPGTSWFGHPAFELPRREQVEAAESLTFKPSAIRVLNRACWEAARLALPVLPAVTLAGWIVTLPGLQASTNTTLFHFVALPGAVLVTALAACLLTWVVKWTVMGRMREAQHVLWSCWCSRWDFLFEVWSAYARPVIESIEGTPLVAPWLRAMGARIGERVVLGTSLAQLVDPDMLHIEDDATVSCHLQLHSFEDRVLKLGRSRFGARSTVAAGALVLYGAEIGPDTRVGEQSVVMKHEHLTAGARYAGIPTRPLAPSEGLPR